MSKLGASGSEPSHVERDFWRVLDKEIPLELDPFGAEVHFKAAQHGLGLQKKTQWFLLPHELLCFLATECCSTQLYSEDLGVDGVRDFWRSAGLQEWFQLHPHRAAVVADPCTCIPIRLHGDDCKEFMCLSWTSTQIRQFARNPVTCFVSAEATDETYDEIDIIWRWCLDVLASGHWPTANHLGQEFTSGYRQRNAGQPFPGNLRAVLAQILADWKWIKERMGFPQHYGAFLHVLKWH